MNVGIRIKENSSNENKNNKFKNNDLKVKLNKNLYIEERIKILFFELIDDFINENSAKFPHNHYPYDSDLNFKKFYLRIIKDLKIDTSTFIITLIYLDEILIKEKLKLFFEKFSYDNNNKQLLFKLFIASLSISLKFNEDVIFDYKEFADFLEISVQDLYNLESLICKSLDFNFYVNFKKFKLYCRCVLKNI